MSLLSPTSRPRLNEATGVVLLAGAMLLWLCLLSYQAQDASWNTDAGMARAHNLIGPLGAQVSGTPSAARRGFSAWYNAVTPSSLKRAAIVPKTGI